jgi:hypothetical protein
MKVLAAFAVAAFTLSAGAQTATSTSTSTLTGPNHTQVAQSSATTASRSGLNAANEAAAQSGKMSARTAQATNIQAELTKHIDSKHAKVGDAVFAKTTSTARLADGTKLPKGTKLLGHVTEVSRESGKDKESSLAFGFDHAVLRGGREVPIHAVMRSLTVPRPLTADADSGFGADSGLGGQPMGGGAMRGGAIGGGGLLGGASQGGANLAGGAEGGLAMATHNAAGTTAGMVNANAGGGMRGLGATTNGAMGSGAGATMMPVGNLRGVTFDGSGNTGSSAMLEGRGRNISLESGSQMTLGVSASH